MPLRNFQFEISRAELAVPFADVACRHSLAQIASTFGRPSWNGNAPASNRLLWLFVIWVISMAFLLPQRVANAEIVFDTNVTPNTAYFSDAGRSGQRIYDDFVLDPSLPTAVNIAAWSGVYATRTVVPDDFTVEFWDNSGTRPGNLLTSMNVGSVSRVQNGTLNIGASQWDIYDYQVSFNPINFNPNQTYWISIRNNTSQGWAWVTDRNRGQIAFRTSPNGFLFNTTSTMKFRLESTPEPGSSLMFLIGIAFSMKRRRRIRATS